MRLNDLTTFNGLIGARDAIDDSVKLLDFMRSHTPYANGPKALLENEIFKLSPTATPSNTDVP